MRTLATIFAALFLSSPALAEQRLFMLDFVFLNKGVELAARDAYNARAAPIAARHGVALQATLDPVRIVIGPQNLSRLDLWTLPAPEALKAWGDDPDYVAMRPEILAVHDMTQLTLYLAREMAPVGIGPKGLYWLEFLRFAEVGFDPRQFSDYVREIDGIAATSGMRRVATFGKIGKILGPGNEAHWLNVYSVPDAEKLQDHVKHPRFVELAPVRERLFDLDRSMMGVFVRR